MVFLSVGPSSGLERTPMFPTVLFVKGRQDLKNIKTGEISKTKIFHMQAVSLKHGHPRCYDERLFIHVIHTIVIQQCY